MDFVFAAIKFFVLFCLGLYLYLLLIRVIGFKMAVWVKINVFKQPVPENEQKITLFGRFHI